MAVRRLIPVRKDEWVNDHFRAKFGVSSGVSEDFEIGQKVKVQIWAVSRLALSAIPNTVIAVDCKQPGLKSNHQDLGSTALLESRNLRPCPTICTSL